MKTAISLPDGVFERIERQIEVLGVSRSRFMSVAAERYLRELEGEEVTALIDAAVTTMDDAERAAQAEWTRLGQAGLAHLTDSDEW